MRPSLLAVPRASDMARSDQVSQSQFIHHTPNGSFSWEDETHFRLLEFPKVVVVILAYRYMAKSNDGRWMRRKFARSRVRWLIYNRCTWPALPSNASQFRLASSVAVAFSQAYPVRTP